MRNGWMHSTKGQMMLAFHNDPALKQATLDRLAEHRRLDQLVRGTYWRHGKGCAVGCTVRDLAGKPIAKLRGGGHELYPTLLGIPEQLAWLEDGIFEALDEGTAMAWPQRFVAAIPVGADLSCVAEAAWAAWAAWAARDAEAAWAADAADAADAEMAANELVRLLQSAPVPVAS